MTAPPALRRFARYATAAVSLLVSMTASERLAAQPVTRDARRAPGATAAAVARRDSGGGVVVRKAAVRMTADPGAIVVIRVPIPAELQPLLTGANNGLYTVVTRANVKLLGSAAGSVASGRDAIPLSFNLGRRASAGVSEIAVVEFRADSTTFEVPVELDVAHVGAIRLQLSDADLVAPQGRWSVLRVRVLNGGNAPDAVTLQLAPLPGWRFETGRAITIPAGGVSETQVRLWVPPRATVGLTVLQVMAHRGPDMVSDGQARVQVRSVDEGTVKGLNVTVSTMAVSALDQRTPVMGYSLAMTGQLTDNITVDARGTHGNSRDQGAVFALARSGMFTVPPSIALSGPRFSASAGVLSTPLMDPGNGALFGLGGTGAVRAGPWRVSAFGGVPFDQLSDRMGAGDGTLVGAGLERQALAGTVGVQAIHLEDRQSRQALESVTLHGSQLRAVGGLIDVSVAARRFGNDPMNGLAGLNAPAIGGGGTGPVRFDARPTFGGSSTYRRVGAAASYEVRVMHAPGDGLAFSRSGTDILTSASRQLSKYASVTGSSWLQRDNNQFVGALASTGWFISPTVATAAGRLRISLEGRGSDMTVANGGVSYGNAETMVGANTEIHVGRLLLRGRSLVGSMDRSIVIADSPTSATRGMREDRQGTVGLVTGRGTLDATWTFSGVSSAAGSSMLAQQGLQLRLDGLRLLPLGAEWIVANGEAQRLGVGANGSGMWMWHGDVKLPLPGGLAMTGSVDLNPYLRRLTGGGGAPLVYALRVDQSRKVNRVGTQSRRGRRLFVDENGNGRFDGDDAPLGGVTLQCGAVAVSSDVSGRFPCAEAHVTVDVRTLPLGIVAPSGATPTRGDVALHRVEPVSVALTVAVIDAVRLSATELSKAVVAAYDVAGTRWYARQSGAAMFTFDALPLGRYRVDIEQGALSEPLTIADDSTALWVSRTRQAAPLQIAVRGRQTRVKVIGPALNTIAASDTLPGPVRHH